MFDFARDRARIAVILVDGFSVLSFGSIVEPFRLLADEFPRMASALDLIALDGQRAVSNSGIAIDCHLDLGAENLGSKNDPLSVRRARADKKRLLPSPCGRHVKAPPWVWLDAPESDTRTIDQAVGGTTKPNT